MHFDLMKNNMAALNNERVVQIDFTEFLSAILTKEGILSQSRVKFFSFLLLNSSCIKLSYSKWKNTVLNPFKSFLA